MRIHPDLEEARHSAGAYVVLPSERGWNLWMFRPWAHRLGGWRIVVPDLRTREDAWLHVLKRLGLMTEDAPAPLPPATIPMRVEEEWD